MVLTKVYSKQNLVTALFTLSNVDEVPCYAPLPAVTLGVWRYFLSVETKLRPRGVIFSSSGLDP